MFDVELSSQVKRFLKKMDKSDSLRTLKKFEQIRIEPFKFLEHFEGDGYKFRVGKYRALIDVDVKEKILWVRVLDLRGRIYK